MILTLPPLTGVTTPDEFTVAIDVSLLLHVTVPDPLFPESVAVTVPLPYVGLLQVTDGLIEALLQFTVNVEDFAA